MKNYLPILLLVLSIACTKKQESPTEEKPSANQASKAGQPEETSVTPEEDQYKLILKHVDNRVIVYMNDSTVFDTGMQPGGPYEKEIDLTQFVNANKTNLKVELYNSNPPNETMKPGWMIVYDIFINDEVVEFVTEKKNEGTVGVVFTETYDLATIW